MKNELYCMKEPEQMVVNSSKGEIAQSDVTSQEQASGFSVVTK